jgi:hypothetical protein
MLSTPFGFWVDRRGLTRENASMGRDFGAITVSLVGNNGHGAAACVAQPKVAELP